MARGGRTVFDLRKDIRAAQALLGPAEVKTIKMSARVFNRGGRVGDAFSKLWCERPRVFSRMAWNNCDRARFPRPADFHPAPPKLFPAPLNSFFDSPYCFFGDKRNNRDYQISSTIAWARNLAAKFRVETIVPLHVGCRFLLWRPKKELGRSKRFSVPA